MARNWTLEPVAALNKDKLRVVIPILWLVMAVPMAAISAAVAHDGFGIASDTIRTDALSSAGFLFMVLAFGNLLRRNR